MPRKSLATLFAASLLLVALACAGTASAAIPAGNTGWSWANPLPQGNTLESLEVSGGRAWAGGATGTLLHSDDSGASWVAVRTGLLDDIRTIEAISPTTVVFAGKCALRRSDDGGATVRRLAWGSNDDSCAASIQAISFPSPLIGYLLLSNGDVYSTNDAGESWKKQGVVPGSSSGNGADAVRDLYFTATGTGVVSVGNRIMQTVDAGLTWNPAGAADSGPGQFNFRFVSASVGYAVGDHADILKTTDGGTTWAAVPGDFATRVQNLTGISCASESTCLATIAGSVFLLRTTDGGAHWTVVTGSSSDPIYAAGFASGSQAVAVGQGGASAVSTDGGANWRPGTSSASGKFNEIRVDSAKSAFIFGEGGAIARSVNGGQSWVSLKQPNGVTLTDATSAGKRIYVVSNPVPLMLSTDGGQNWKVVNTGTNTASRAIFAWSPARVLLVGLHGVRVSEFSGSKSKPVAGKISKLSLTSVDAAGKTVYVYGSSAIAATADKGKTWKFKRKPKGSGAIKRLEMLDAKNGYLLDSKAELYFTKNGGTKWTRIETTGANVAISMAFGDRKHGYLTDNTGRVLATVDGGKTWARQYPFYDSTAKSNAFVEASGRLSASTLVAGTNRVFTTTTGGRIGSSSRLTIKPSAVRVSKNTVVRVTGKLTPANGTERVTVLARVVNAKGGTRWTSVERTVSTTGTFTTAWKITAATEFIARWSGDAAHDGDAAPLAVVKLRK